MRAQRKTVLTAAAACLGSLLLALPAWAAVDLGLEYATGMGLTTTDIRTTVARIISYFLGFLGIVAVCIILYAGFLWMTAAGNEEQVLKAKKTLTSAVIGLVIILSAFAITQFIIRAITGEGAGPGAGCTGAGCHSGCAGFDCPGGGDAFMVDGVMPVGGAIEWPKNAKLELRFNANVDQSTVTSSTVQVFRCNKRSETGKEDFDDTKCGTTAIAVEWQITDNRVVVNPTASPQEGDNTDSKTWFEGFYWYKVVMAGDYTGAGGGTYLKDTDARDLYCYSDYGGLTEPPKPQDTTGEAMRLCTRAVAFSNKVDLAPPAVNIAVPQNQSHICGLDKKILADANDDFAAKSVELQLVFPSDETGHTPTELGALKTSLTNRDGQELLPITTDLKSVANDFISKDPAQVNPFFVDRLDNLLLPSERGRSPFINIPSLLGGIQNFNDQKIILRAKATDLVGHVSDPVETLFKVTPAHCCNGIKDEDEDEIDCGAASVCGSCDVCTTTLDCNDSQVCVAGHCTDLPVIDSVSQDTGAVGQLITFHGSNFGADAGSIIFPPAPGIAAAPCKDGAWQPTSVTVRIPAGAATGPIKLQRADGQVYDSDPAVTTAPIGWKNTIKVNAGAPKTSPAICALQPYSGYKETGTFKIFGDNFGTGAGSFAKLGLTDTSPTNWAAQEVDTRVPRLAEGQYKVRISVNGVTTAEDPLFSILPDPGEETPKIISINPPQATPGSLVTVVGTGFGPPRGTVFFSQGADSQPHDAPPAICGEYWHRNYIVVQVPKEFGCPGPAACKQFVPTPGPDTQAFKIQVQAQNGKRSNLKDFTVKRGDPGPGICAIEPDNGKPGINATVKGVGLGDKSQPGAVYSIQFYNGLDAGGNVQTIDVPGCDNPLGGPNCWSDKTVMTQVPGDPNVKTSWPQSGPVTALAAGVPSTNGIPFKVQDCNEAGGNSACEVGKICCPNGSCEADQFDQNGKLVNRACTPAGRGSVYGWLFSTEILPDLPVVRLCPYCKSNPQCPEQSPSPYAGSVDACVNAIIRLEFNRVMSSTSFNGGYKVEECGTSLEPNCQAATDVTAKFDRDPAASLYSGGPVGGPVGSVFRLVPDTVSYNGGLLKQKMWYRVTLFGDHITDAAEPAPRHLDGDFNRTEGGDYSFTFRVRDSGQACQISDVAVSPNGFTVDHKGDTGDSKTWSPLAPPDAEESERHGFISVPLAANCNELACENPTSHVPYYDIGWTVADPVTLLLQPVASLAFDQCVQPLTAEKETVVGSPVKLTAVMTSKPVPGQAQQPKAGASDIQVKFADPRVTAYGPKCNDACIDSEVWFRFNVLMNHASINANTVELHRCRNVTCNPPYETAGQPGFDTPAVSCVDASGITECVVNVTGLNLAPNSYYIVNLKGQPVEGETPLTDPDFISSASGVQLKFLNAAPYFNWTFRTKDSLVPCTVNRTEINPPEAVVRYVGDKAGFSVIPYGAPDDCDPRGQRLSASGRDWLWSVGDLPSYPPIGVVSGFIPNAYLAVTDATRLNTTPNIPAGCGMDCRNIGSQALRPQCGNGLVEKGERCDKVGGVMPDWCDPTNCLIIAHGAPDCGDGVVGDGEECDKVNGDFPPGCKDPACNGAEGDPASCTPATTGDTSSDGRPEWKDNGCVWMGSAAGNSTCGDGVVGDGEECDDGNTGNNDGCSGECLLEGTRRSCLDVSPYCGDKPEETCDPSNPADVTAKCGAGKVCVRPACVNFCGNGRDEPGEDPGCDTGPGTVADGCDPTTCLKQGTPACGTVGAGLPCCGNGTKETGEECDKINGVMPDWCSGNCLLKGSSWRYSRASFCGDGYPVSQPLPAAALAWPSAPADPASEQYWGGEEPRCEQGVTHGDAHIDPFQVVVAGRPAPPGGAQAQTSFIDKVAAKVDGVAADKVGKAKVTMSCVCAQQQNPDAFCDALTIDPQGSPDYDLGCDNHGCCDTPPAVTNAYPTGQNECRNTLVRVPFDRPVDGATVENNLVVALVLPEGQSCQKVCDNNRSRSCTEATKAADCGADVNCVDPEIQVSLLDDGRTAPPTGLSGWRSLWRRLSAFLRSLFVRDAGAVGPVYCRVSGRVMSVGSTSYFYPSNAFKGLSDYKVFVRGRAGAYAAGESGVQSANGVSMPQTYTFTFKTRADLCKIDYVTVTPPSHLFTTADDLGGIDNPNDKIDGDQDFMAHAHPAGGVTEAEIATTPEYTFFWHWAQQPSQSVITLASTTPSPVQGNGVCEYAQVCQDGASAGQPCPPDGGAICPGKCGVYESPTSPDCSAVVGQGGVPAVPPGCGNGICESTESAQSGGPKTHCPSDCKIAAPQTPAVVVRVRQTPPPAPLPGNDQKYPKNGEATVDVTANIRELVSTGIVSSQMKASSDVTVMLCSQPWPKRRACGDVLLNKLPWDKNFSEQMTCNNNDDLVWYPFYDPQTNISFYYCRAGGPEDKSGAILPALNEEKLVSISPGRPDILREYLFTYDRLVAPESGPWDGSAIGLRIAKNTSHESITDWYVGQGFGGGATSTKVDGYDALQEGRTVYVNAAAMSQKGADTGSIYTNVNVLSYSEGAAAETVNIFNQVVGNLNMNRNIKEPGYCWGEDSEQLLDGLGNAVGCAADRECWLKADGSFDRTKSGAACLANKSKLIRDLKRWSDLPRLQQTLMTAKESAGSYPRLEAGTFLRSRTVSAWPSWAAVLGSALGVGGLPTDPVDGLFTCADPTECGGLSNTACTAAATCAWDAKKGANGECVSQFDPATCWDARDKVYMCPVGSHVYEYRTVGGAESSILADFESTLCKAYRNEATCAAQSNFCEWSGGACQLISGVHWAGSNCIERRSAPTCTNGCKNSSQGCQPTDADNNVTAYEVFAGVNVDVPNCNNTQVDGKMICGDGIVQQRSGTSCASHHGNPSACNNDLDLQGQPNCQYDAPVSECLPAGEQCEPASVPDVRTCSTTQKTCWLKGDLTCDVNADCQVGSANYGPCQNRDGSRQRPCTTSCTWGDFGQCVAGYCGDGKVQAPEKCDDGSLNGTYGHCRTDCGVGDLAGGGYGARCGDGAKQPNEACDCPPSGGVSLNGAYHFNALLQDPTMNDGVCPAANDTGASDNSCSWDCSAAGPGCGDGIINGSEECDGATESYQKLCSTSLTPCSADADCAGGNKCTELCDPTHPERKWVRACGTNDPRSTDDDGQACKWTAFQAGVTCTDIGYCGNGNKETGEECDSGPSTDNHGDCIIDKIAGVMCRSAHCGDGYLWLGKEQCDAGDKNGIKCQPDYGRPCTYCTSACQFGTVSGGYCGNGKVEDKAYVPPGPEECDGPLGIDDWICVSTKTYEQVYGRQTGLALCAEKDCKRSCEGQDAKPCYNQGSNTDQDKMSPATWTDRYGETHPTVLKDSCDPDADDDGVPNVNDCAPLDPLIHPAYGPITILDDKGNPVDTFSVPAAPEYCDGVDNDCNGVIDDNWTAQAKPGQATRLIKGEVRDALFVSFPVASAVVSIVKSVCAANQTTFCSTLGSDPTACGETDPTCGVNDPTLTPVTMADNWTPNYYSFNLTDFSADPNAPAYCKFKITVTRDAPAKDLDVPGFAGNHPLEDRSQGYWPASRDLPGPGVTETPTFYMMPKVKPGQAMVAFTWNGALPGFLDAHLKVPAVPNRRVYWSSQGNIDLSVSPYAYLSCFHEDGSQGCGSFSTAPETTIWDWGNVSGANITKPARYIYFINNYSCQGDGCQTDCACSDNPFIRDGETRVLLSTPSAIYSWQPPSNGGKFWYVFDLNIDASGNLSVDEKNSIVNTAPVW